MADGSRPFGEEEASSPLPQATNGSCLDGASSSTGRSASDAGVTAAAALASTAPAALAPPPPPPWQPTPLPLGRPPPSSGASLYLQVDVIEARGLSDRASDGVGPAAYVKASVHQLAPGRQAVAAAAPGPLTTSGSNSLGHHHHHHPAKTRTVYRNRHPMWDQSLLIPLSPVTASWLAAAATAVAAGGSAAAPSPHHQQQQGPSVLLLEAHHRIDLTRKALLGRLVLSLEDVAAHAAADEAAAAAAAAAAAGRGGGWYRLSGPSIPVALLSSAPREEREDDNSPSSSPHGALRLRLRLLGAAEGAAAAAAAAERTDAERLALALSRRALRVRVRCLAKLASSGLLKEVVALGLASAAAQTVGGAGLQGGGGGGGLAAAASANAHDPPPPLSLVVRLGRVWVEKPLPLSALLALAERQGLLAACEGSAGGFGGNGNGNDDAAKDELAVDEEVMVPLSSRALRVLRRRDELVDVRVYVKSGEATLAKAQVPLAMLLPRRQEQRAASSAAAAAAAAPAVSASAEQPLSGSLTRRSSPVVFDLTADSRRLSASAPREQQQEQQQEVAPPPPSREPSPDPSLPASSVAATEHQQASSPSPSPRKHQGSVLARALRSSRKRLTSFSFSRALTPVASVELEGGAGGNGGGGGSGPSRANAAATTAADFAAPPDLPCATLTASTINPASADPSASGEEAYDALTSLRGGVAAAAAAAARAGSPPASSSSYALRRPPPPPLLMLGGGGEGPTYALTSPSSSPSPDAAAAAARSPVRLLTSSSTPDSSSAASTPTRPLCAPGDEARGAGATTTTALSLLRRSLSSVAGLPGGERMAAAAAAAVAAVRSTTTGGGGGGGGSVAATTPPSPQSPATMRRVATFACVRSLEAPPSPSGGEASSLAATAPADNGGGSSVRPLGASSLPLQAATASEAKEDQSGTIPSSPRAGNNNKQQQQQQSPLRPATAPPRRTLSSGLLAPAAGGSGLLLLHPTTHGAAAGVAISGNSGLTTALRSGGSFSSGRWAEAERALRAALRAGEGPVQADWVAVPSAGGSGASPSLSRSLFPPAPMRGVDGGGGDDSPPPAAPLLPAVVPLVRRVMDSQIPLQCDLEVSLALSVEPYADSLDASLLAATAPSPPDALSSSSLGASRRLATVSAGRRAACSSRSPSPVLAGLVARSVPGTHGIAGAALAAATATNAASSLPTTPTATATDADATGNGNGGTSTDDDEGGWSPPAGAAKSAAALLLRGTAAPPPPPPPLPMPDPLPIPLASDACLPLSPARVFALVFGRRSASFMAALHRAESLADVRVGPWELEGGAVAPRSSPLAGRRRVVCYTRPLSIPLPFAPKSCRITEEQRLLAASGRGAGGGFVAEIRAASDAPRGDAFVVRVQLAVAPAAVGGVAAASGGGSFSHVRATLSVDFSKSVLGRGVIEANAAGDSRRVYGALLAALGNEAATVATAAGAAMGASNGGGARIRNSSNGGAAAAAATASATVAPAGGLASLDGDAKAAALLLAAANKASRVARLSAWLQAPPSSGTALLVSSLVRLLSACLIAWALLRVAVELRVLADAVREAKAATGVALL